MVQGGPWDDTLCYPTPPGTWSFAGGTAGASTACRVGCGVSACVWPMQITCRVILPGITTMNH